MPLGNTVRLSWDDVGGAVVPGVDGIDPCPSPSEGAVAPAGIDNAIAALTTAAVRIRFLNKARFTITLSFRMPADVWSPESTQVDFVLFEP